MSTIEIESYKVIKACDAGLDWIKNYRNEALREAIQKQMARTRFSLRELGRVPVHASEAEALAYLKDGSRDFFGSTYDHIMSMGCLTEDRIKNLRGMAGEAPTVSLSAKDYELIKGHL